MRSDAYHLPASTGSPEALDAYNRGVAGVLGWHRDTIEFFREATELDPGFALAHAGLAVSLFVEERFAEARTAAQTARARATSASARERSHVEALALYVEVRMQEAEQAMREHLVAYPVDLLIAQRLYFIWFFQGRNEEMLGLTAALLPRLPDTSFVHGLHAFVLEEVGRCDEALRVAEFCVERNPQDTWGVHALVHTLYEMGAAREGLTRLPPALAVCPDMNYYRNHLLWHLVLMHLYEGDYARASTMTHAVFEREPSPLALDLRNSISALWRLELCGMDVKTRWPPFVEIGRGLLERPEDLPFHHPHIAMVLAGGADWPTAERHLDHVRSRAAGDRSGVLGEVVVPLIEGVHAFGRQEWGDVIESLEPIRDQVIRLGGSRTQRDVFHDTLLEACFRAGDGERAERYLAERLSRRRDHFWVHRKRAA
jgi:tetratricopeptide (TPR) repeat protein